MPEGGYFLWLDLKDDVDSKALLAEAKEEGVTFVAGPDFMLEGGSSSLRLSFAPVPAGESPRAFSASPAHSSGFARALPPRPRGGRRESRARGGTG